MDAPEIQSRPPRLESELKEGLARVEDRLEALEVLFQSRIQEDTVKGDLFQRLHNDLARYRDDFIFNHVTRRLFTDVIRLFDRLEDFLKGPAPQALGAKEWLDQLGSFRAELLQCLRRQEVNLVESRSAGFDETWQEALGTEAVETPDRDLRVLRVLRRGFTYRGRVLRPEGVVVGRYERGPTGSRETS